MRIMDKIASGAELAVLMLVVIATHLLSENWLVLHQFLYAVGKETVVPVAAVSCLCIALAKLQFSLHSRMGCSFIINHFYTH